jgi:phosphoribosylanthranilate isomerase
MWDKFIQIAGIKSLQEAEMLIANGVEYLGFPLRLTVNTEDTTEAEAQNIIAKVKNKAQPVLITYLKDANEIVDFCNYLSVNIVQLHGEIEIEELKKLRTLYPALKIIKSLVVKENNKNELFNKILNFSDLVDAFITDTFDPETKAEGATGKTHDWNISREIVKISPKPVILAGGLNPENVTQAIEFVNPAGVDSHTGVEDEEGNKDPGKVKKFVENSKLAFSRRGK